MATSLRHGRNRLAMRLWWRTWTGRILTAVRAVSAPANSCSTGEPTYELGDGCFRRTDASVTITRFFQQIPAFSPNSDSLPSLFGQGVGVP